MPKTSKNIQHQGKDKSVVEEEQRETTFCVSEQIQLKAEGGTQTLWNQNPNTPALNLYVKCH